MFINKRELSFDIKLGADWLNLQLLRTVFRSSASASQIYFGVNFIPPLIAELRRAKRASEAPWVRKIGNLSSRENLVMTVAYERPYVRTSVQTRGEGERRLEIFLPLTHTGN